MELGPVAFLKVERVWWFRVSCGSSCGITALPGADRRHQGSGIISYVYLPFLGIGMESAVDLTRTLSRTNGPGFFLAGWSNAKDDAWVPPSIGKAHASVRIWTFMYSVCRYDVYGKRQSHSHTQTTSTKTHASSAQQNAVSKKCTRRRYSEEKTRSSRVLTCFSTSALRLRGGKMLACPSRSRGGGSTASDGRRQKHVRRANRQQSDHVSGLPRHAKKQGRVLDLVVVGRRGARAGDAVDGWDRVLSVARLLAGVCL